MNLIVNNNEYEVERLSFSTTYLEAEEKLNQNLNITLKDNSFANELNLATIQSLQQKINIDTEDENPLVFEDFHFEAFDIFADVNDKRFDLRFSKQELLA